MKTLVLVGLLAVTGCAVPVVSQEETASIQQASSVKTPAELNASEVAFQPEATCSAMFEGCTAIPCCGGLACVDTTGGSPNPVYVCVWK